MNPILVAAASLVVGVILALTYQNYLKTKGLTKKDTPTKKDTDTHAKEIILEARDEAFRIKKQAEEEVRKVRSETMALEAKLASSIIASQ